MRLIVVSNRLPLSVTIDNGKISTRSSAGGLATGLLDYLGRYQKKAFVDEYVWVGWPGTAVAPKDIGAVARKLAPHNMLPVFLTEEQIKNFYLGFANDTLWPLFHWFQSYVNYNQQQWNSYRQVNALFAETVAKIYQPGDVIWVHDYHLLLVPKLLREKLGPEAPIGFFLHIPFPSYEIFRLLPDKWRRSLLDGMLGADLVGFHTYDYTNYFNTSVQRILGFESNMLKITAGGRAVKVDTFPMGIDFKKFNQAARTEAVEKERRRLKQTVKSLKVIMSVDRLDYTKGIIKRLQAYELFLDNNKHWREKVVLMLVVVPSRAEVESYQRMKSQIDELVGKINGKFGQLSWTPIIYQYKSLNFEQIAALYSVSDVALVTPLRDGMNLVAKEYIATRRDLTGVLILSEMAGTVYELGEAIIVNPNHEEAIAEAIVKALKIPASRQKSDNLLMRERLKRYSVNTWAEDFITSLIDLKTSRGQTSEDKIAINSLIRAKIIRTFWKSKRRLILLDYDGTLVPYVNYPFLAKPKPEIKAIISKLTELPRTRVIIMSGRDRQTLGSWFKKMRLTLVAEHGVWIKETNKLWKNVKPLNNSWKSIILPTLKRYADRLPGAFVEEKDSSLVWHYRLANPWHAQEKVKELTAHLVSATANLNVQVTQGQKNIEIRTAGVDKGSTALQFLDQADYGFILAAGDDSTDEDMFKALPDSAYSIKIGTGFSAARYWANSPEDLLSILWQITKNKH